MRIANVSFSAHIYAHAGRVLQYTSSLIARSPRARYIFKLLASVTHIIESVGSLALLKYTIASAQAAQRSPLRHWGQNLMGN